MKSFEFWPVPSVESHWRLSVLSSKFKDFTVLNTCTPFLTNPSHHFSIDLSWLPKLWRPILRTVQFLNRSVISEPAIIHFHKFSRVGGNPIQTHANQKPPNWSRFKLVYTFNFETRDFKYELFLWLLAIWYGPYSPIYWLCRCKTEV